MLISVFTPVHPPSLTWLGECYDSLCEQTAANWEWVVAPNRGAVVPERITADERVKVCPFPDDWFPPVEHNGKNPGIGALKRYCCERCSGDAYVELDCDDLLRPDALEKIGDAFSKGAQFVYSDFAEFEDKTWKKRHYNLACNWEMYDFEYKGHMLHAMRAWPPHAASFLSIYWAPNHVRAWTREAYWMAGGHSRELVVADDHAMNTATYLAVGEAGCTHIEEPIYLYRVHGDGTNSCWIHNDAIQDLSKQTYYMTVLNVAKRFALDRGLRAVDLGGAIDAPDGLETVDTHNADVIANLNKKWPFKDGSVGVVRASHVLEHLPDSIHTMNELYRVLAPGGFALIEVPSTDGRGAFQDPTHCSFWNVNSFKYYTDRRLAKYIPEFTGKFQTWNIRDVDVGDRIIITQAELLCLKPPYSDRPVGRTLI